MPLTIEQIEENYHQEKGQLSLDDMGLTDEDLPVLNEFLREHANRITQISLDDNALTKAPNLQSLEKLECLFIMNNQLIEAPNVLGLNQLEVLSLSINKLKESPNVQGLRKLKILRLTSNQIIKAPKVLGLSNLEVLKLNENQLTEAPDVQGLDCLKELDLNDNQLKKAPDVQGLGCLEELDISENQLTEAPDVQGLDCLKKLDLSDNQLRKAPDVQGLRQLLSLDLSFNFLTEAPNLQGLGELRSLHLQFNYFTEAPNIEGLRHLEPVNLSENQLAEALAKNNAFYKKLYFMNVLRYSKKIKFEEGFPISKEQGKNFESLKVTKRDVLEFICDYFSKAPCKELVGRIKIGDTSLRTFSQGDLLDKVLEFFPSTDSFYNRRKKIISYLNGIIPKDFGLVEGQTVREIAVEFLKENYAIYRFLNYKINSLTVMYDNQEVKENYESKCLEAKTKP